MKVEQFIELSSLLTWSYLKYVFYISIPEAVINVTCSKYNTRK